jgi:hypothetical protein
VQVNERLSAIERALNEVASALYFLLLRTRKMATKQDVLEAAAAEGAQVKVRLDALEATITALRDELAAGDPVTAEDLDEIKLAIQNIFTPAAEVPPEGLPPGF